MVDLVVVVVKVFVWMLKGKFLVVWIIEVVMDVLRLVESMFGYLFIKFVL